MLNPKDLFNIAKALKLQPIDVVKQYCETFIRESSHFPIIRLKPQGSIKRCPLLKDKSVWFIVQNLQYVQHFLSEG